MEVGLTETRLHINYSIQNSYGCHFMDKRNGEKEKSLTENTLVGFEVLTAVVMKSSIQHGVVR
jgi:hypothetical protein